jgi:hypothetical protein
MNKLCELLIAIMILLYLFAFLTWAAGKSKSKKKAVSAAFRLCDGIGKKFKIIISLLRAESKRSL